MAICIARIENPTDYDRAAIIAPLDEFSRAKGFPFLPQTLALGLRDNGRLVGGLIAQVSWNWLHIQLLGVPTQLRGLSLGRALVEQAEADAASLGCVGVWVDTFTFQSPGFYERCGYVRFGELANYPDTEARIFFRKILGGRRIEHACLAMKAE